MQGAPEVQKGKPPAQGAVAPKGQERLVRRIDADTEGGDTASMNKTVIVVYVVLLLLGTLTGYVLAGTGAQAGLSGGKPEIIKTDKVVGSTDTRTFKDSAQGKLEKGGIDGEGTHHLVRDGGPSQTVYLTSSIVDLDEFVGKNVTVWGQTMAAQKAGWLMDVGKVELK